MILLPREMEIAAWVAQGCANKQIAETLGISQKTVASHIYHIYRKLKINNRVQLTNWFLSVDNRKI